MRLIDECEINKHYDENKLREYGDLQKRLSDTQILMLYLQSITDCKTVDAIQVVRCKDCKHYDMDKMQKAGFDTEYHWCTHCGWQEPTWFCAGGERKDNAVD